ncbi:unnamed protein product [Didymodactylos carnosus]|uniref:Uncharacterized protein n=1 Tax=Didymodactylos carnosus TaxID=1234261 RepID=A0A814JLC5_9BILA|nr:unnamed protein product [Didymodactylos carnosus]CAF1039626.1 unnamed protein product [Didymodactylos carnosus]CAF3669677.1 unnamed protein product [Didymodactylos carnosus]CAF3809929.1 unnamed protein product [Didymodactylos carnosus]
MLHLNPYTAVFPVGNKTELLLSPEHGTIDDVKAVWNPNQREVLFMITRRTEELDNINYMIGVNFDTLKILEKKVITKKQVPLFDMWEYFYFS